jgi:PAS domain S-box-containing protein
MKTSKTRTKKKDWQKADARVLGQILAAQNVDFVLPDSTHIADFFAETLIAIPGTKACRVCLHEASAQRGEMEIKVCEGCKASRKKTGTHEEIHAFEPGFKCGLVGLPGMEFSPIASSFHHFGFFVFHVDEVDTFNIYKPFVDNLANYVALSLENRRQRDQLQKARDDLERRVEERTRELMESKGQIKQLIDFSPVAMVVSSGAEQRVDFVNDKFIELFGYTIEDIPDVTRWWSLAYPDERYREEIKTQWETKFNEAIKNKSQIEPMEAIVTCKDGSQRYVEFCLSSIGEKHLVTFVDLTERRKAEEAQHQLNRELRAISNCNQALLRAVDEQTLLDDICRIICDEAGYRMAWVGYPRHDQALGGRLVAWAGAEEGYLAAADIITRSTPQRELGSNEIVVWSGVTTYVYDFATDPEAAPWREVALQHGYRSKVGLPLKDENANTFGVLHIYSAEPNAFTSYEIRLLEELAGDLAFGITALRTRAERKQAEEALRESETRFRAVFENSVDAIGVSKAGTHVFVNPAYLALFGYIDNAELTGRPILDLIAPSHREQTLENVRHRAGGQPAPATYETRGLKKDGSEFDMDVHVSTYDLNGEVYTVAHLRDITERKQAEKALRESEEKLRQIASSLREVIWLRDAQTRQVLYVNPAFQELTGRTCESFYENRDVVMEAIHPDDREAVIKALAQRSEIAHYDKEHRIIHLDGSAHWVSSRSFPVRNETGEVYRWATIMEDITERKQAVDALHERERHSQSLLRLSRNLERAQTYTEVLNAARNEVKSIVGYQNLWAYLFTEDKRLAHAIFAGGPLEKVVMSENGTATLTVQGDRMLEEIVEAKEIVVVEDAQIDDRVNREIVEMLGNRTIVNVPILLFDRHLGSVGMGTFREEGVRVPTASEREYLVALASHMAVTLDRIHLLNTRRQAEQSLRENEEKFRTLIEQSAEGVMLADENGEIVEWNHAYERITGLEQSQVLGKPVWDMMTKIIAPERATEEQIESIKAGILEALRTGKSPLFAAPTEMEFHPVSSGEKHYLHQTIFPIKMEKGYRIASLVEDITERKRAEQNLRQMNERFSLAARAARLGVWDWDIQKDELVWNDGMYELYGVKREDFAGAYEAWLKGIHPDDRTLSDEISQQARRGEREYDTEFRVVWPDGGIHYLKAYGQFVRDADGKPLRMTGVNFDITERKQAEETLRTTKILLEQTIMQSPVPMVLVSMPDAVIRYVNPAARHFLGIEDELDPTNTPLMDLNISFRDFDLQGKEEFLEELPLVRSLKGIKTEGEERYIIRKDGTIRYELVSGAPIFDDAGQLIAGYLIMMDITERKQAEEALHQSKERFRRLAENARDVIYRMSIPGGKYEYVSSAALSVFGYSPEECYQTPMLIKQAIHPDWQIYFEEQWANLIKGEAPPTYEYQFIHKSGKVCWLNQRNILVRDNVGTPIAIEGIVTDITERKRVEDALVFVAQRGWQTGAENFFDALAQFLGEKLDMDYVLIDKIDENLDMAETVALYAKGGIAPNMRYALKGTPCENVMGRQLCVYPQGIQQLFPEDTLLRGMGAESYIGIPLWDSKGQPIGLIAVMSNKPLSNDSPVTQLLQLVATRAAAELERKQSEEEIRRLNQNLEQRVIDRTAQLEAANKELEAFAYSVSHDLRAPLRHIDGFIDMLRDRMGAGLDDKSLHYMDVIADSARKMGMLIDDLLSFSRMGRNEMSKAQVDLDDLVQEVIRELKHETEGRDIQWKISLLPVVSGDRAMLRIVLVNLIANALKFTRPRETAQIVIGCDENNEGESVISVRDNGVGFDMTYTDKLFGVFQRLHHQKDFEGTGIGLANVRRIISRHGGRTWAEGKVDQGATFYFSLPALKQK